MLPLAPHGPRSCRVSCRDLAGTEHAVAVTAESLYEAVARGHLGRGDRRGVAELKVRVKQPAVEHLKSQGKTPAECTRKRKLMALAKGEGRERRV